MSALATSRALAGTSGAWAAERRAARRRVALVVLVLIALVVVVFVASMMLGSALLSPVQVVAGVFGVADEPSTDFVVRELRLPRALAAPVIGFALGVSGTLFQRVLGNPLASPDFLGVSSGASAAAAAGIVFLGLSGAALAGAAVVGAIAISLAMVLIGTRGGLSGYRFILVGIGLSATAASATSWILSRAEVADAREATTWLIGSVGMADPIELSVLAVGVGLALLGLPLVARLLAALELGDDTARALGGDPERARLVVLAVATVLIALATAAGGPIAFVALMAGPISASLLGRGGPSIVAAGLSGALILQLADIAAQHALPLPISTGVVTGFIGAPYLVWLILSANRKESAG